MSGLQQYTYNIYDGATGELKADSIVGYHYVDMGLTNDQAICIMLRLLTLWGGCQRHHQQLLARH